MGKGKKWARYGTRRRVAVVDSAGLLYDGQPRWCPQPTWGVR
jgi:hypothetical protein